ncbi:MAG: hypothetical protein BWX71_02307 [Deltaproteobacteria bacterium ADurb.Bin072]|nr:MAG: hypothetical protein BWX71_02307 [Deltaproteobacteria bacterium ADurb.Bin072]
MYVDMRMVTTPTRVMSPMVWGEMWPRASPAAATMRENSLICATVSPARNPVLLRYPMAPMMASTMMGLPTSTKSEKIPALPICDPTVDHSRRAPRSMKKKMRRKSRRVTSLAPMASRYSVDASDMPARNAPTSLLSPRWSLSALTSMAQVMANRMSISVEAASSFSSGGRTYRMSSPMPSRSPAILTMTSAMAMYGEDSALLPISKVARPMRARMAMMSCTMRKPSAILPWSESISFLSDRSLTMMMVLEKVRATDT